VLVLGVAWLAAAGVWAEEPGPPRDVDLWHEAFAEAVGGSLVDEVRDGWALGLYPYVGVSAGPPNWVAYQLGGHLSLAKNGKFSLFAGYGYERGPTSLSHMVTVGWGGVRRLSAARPQRGFYGKFFRYRYLEDFSHGVHHGLSIGTDTGAGVFGMGFEVGVARSQNNHWSFTAQVGIKLAVPILIRLSGAPEA
jgi:hypothetical protein